MTTSTAVAAYEEALADLALANEDVVVMTAENRAPIRNLPSLLGPRFVDVGICEQTLVGAAAGLALRGRIPVVHALAAFLVMRAFEFIRTDVGIAGLPVKLVGYVPGFLSEANGPTHQALEDVALMRGIPGMEVFCPADREELSLMLPEILASPQPAYVRYTAMPRVLPPPLPFVRGVAEQVGDGQDVALLTYGLLAGEALRARGLLEAQGVLTRLVNLRSLKPVDEEAIVRAASCGLVAIVEDHFETGGLHSIVAEVLLAHGKTARVLPLSLRERWFKPALLPDVLRYERFTGADIAKRVLAALGKEA